MSHTFLKEIRKELKKIRPDVYLLGEIWHDSAMWLLGDEYDSVMNYPLGQSIGNYFADENRTALDFECDINRCYTLYMEQTNRVLFNLLDSHDTERLRSRVKNMGQFYQQLVLLFTMQGSPCIYYGTEIAMEGAHDPDCRRCMPWGKIAAGKYEKERSLMKELIALRKKYPACRSGNICWKSGNDRAVHYKKEAKGETEIGVFLNASKEKKALPAGKKILFSYQCENGWVLPDGVCVYEA